MNLFENATRKNYTFSSARGSLNVSDLWNLPLLSGKNPCLDTIAAGLHSEILQHGETSFVSSTKPSAKLSELKNKLAVVKRIIEVREEENAKARATQDSAAMRQQLIDALESKEQDAIKEMSADEIREKLKTLAA